MILVAAAAVGIIVYSLIKPSMLQLSKSINDTLTMKARKIEIKLAGLKFSIQK